VSLRSASASGIIVCQEVHAPTTNGFRLFSIQVGGGSPTQGSFTGIDWGSASHFMQVEMDVNGDRSYVNMGTQQLVSVPYALYAESSGQGSLTPSVQVYTSNGVWTRLNGIKYVVVDVLGAGGGTVNSPSNAGGGGGGGGYSKKVISANQLVENESLIVGAGGSGVSGLSGNDGGKSSFGSHLQADGGTGGNGGGCLGGGDPQYAVGQGGIGSMGDLNVYGEAGENGIILGGAGYPGAGGGSHFGGGAKQPLPFGINLNGSNAPIYGGDESGGGNAASSASVLGGNGE
jgi:hypothetical protein